MLESDDPGPKREKSDPRDPDFVPEVLDRTVIAIPLLDEIERDRAKLHAVIIDLNLEFPGGRVRARERVRDLVAVALTATQADSPARAWRSCARHRRAEVGAERHLPLRPSSRGKRTPEVETLTMLEPGEAYTFKPGRLHNLRADRYISNHSDVRNPAVAHALLSAVAVT